MTENKKQNPGIKQYLLPTAFLNFDNLQVAAFAENKAGKSNDPVKQAVNLYYAVRDGIYYDPYAIILSTSGLCASTTLEKGRGWCVAKAILLAACCRHIGLPARLGFADVKNHLSTQRLRQRMKTDVFHWHGYTSICLNDKWIKATPAFNVELCEKFSLKPLEFDGTTDSIYHPFDLQGNRHMEYVKNRGEFADVPLDAIIKTFREKYPADDTSWLNADFDHDVGIETKKT
jgi:transglutaminase-like putative cysteine protease